MSLRVRLFLVILSINLALLGVVQFGSYLLQQSWLSRSAAAYEGYIYEAILSRAYSPELPDGVPRVRELLRQDSVAKFREYFRDVLVANGTSPIEGGSVDLNPLGASHRHAETFPLVEIRDGIRAAMDRRSLEEAGGGYCVAITAAGRVVGGAWFVPRLPPPPQLPFWVFAIPVLIGTLVFGLLIYWSIGRGVVRPLRELSTAAARVGSGQYDVRVPHLEVGRELDAFIDAFNGMAERVEGHHTELAREVRRATEEAKRSERALLLSGRLASMGTLAAGIAHEINNPIGGMVNAVRRIERNESLSERERLYLGLIRDGLERIGRIVRRVLDFSPRQMQAAPFDLIRAVEGARALVEHRLRRQGVELRIDCPETLPRILGDRHEFEQVLLNLFINSLDVLEGRPGPRWIAVGAAAAGDSLEILVEDNGPGMPREQLGLVMTPFFSGKGRPDASGLGMFISHSIIENHGGRIELDSDVGAGFRVRIVLPIVSQRG
jgi:signal transduction histidine kinase